MKWPNIHVTKIQVDAFLCVAIHVNARTSHIHIGLTVLCIRCRYRCIIKCYAIGLICLMNLIAEESNNGGGEQQTHTSTVYLFGI